MTVDGHTLYFTYDAAGTPLTVSCDGTLYYYITNIQGDVITIIDNTGIEVATYSYDAWGNILSRTGSTSTIGRYNPLTYRGYVYDTETDLYYLQSRYYNPETGRFINADAFISTGQGFNGNNMFAYCLNNPVNLVDRLGCSCTSFLPEYYIEATEKTPLMKRYKSLSTYSSPRTEKTSIIESIIDAVLQPSPDGLTFSIGVSGGANWGGAGGGISGNLSVDTSYNYALQGSDMLIASSGVGLGASAGLNFTYTNAMNVQDLSGVSQMYGGTLCEGVGISIDVIKFSPASDPNATKWGISIGLVFGAEAEIHWAESYTSSTQSWNPLINLKKKLFGG